MSESSLPTDLGPSSSNPSHLNFKIVNPTASDSESGAIFVPSTVDELEKLVLLRPPQLNNVHDISNIVWFSPFNNRPFVRVHLKTKGIYCRADFHDLSPKKQRDLIQKLQSRLAEGRNLLEQHQQQEDGGQHHSSQQGEHSDDTNTAQEFSEEEANRLVALIDYMEKNKRQLGQAPKRHASDVTDDEQPRKRSSSSATLPPSSISSDPGISSTGNLSTSSLFTPPTTPVVRPTPSTISVAIPNTAEKYSTFSPTGYGPPYGSSGPDDATRYQASRPDLPHFQQTQSRSTEDEKAARLYHQQQLNHQQHHLHQQPRSQHPSQVPYESYYMEQNAPPTLPYAMQMSITAFEAPPNVTKFKLPADALLAPSTSLIPATISRSPTINRESKHGSTSAATHLPAAINNTTPSTFLTTPFTAWIALSIFSGTKTPTVCSKLLQPSTSTSVPAPTPYFT
ncbi:hypothetical protein HK102_013124 [Quaeritorhiza haematococci]|nr:hypothetical protein HK102_013124 [Quaeritorhiza haematococci]